MNFETVIVESPYAGDIETNIEYAKRAMSDCLNRNEAPYFSHLLYPLVLDDNKPEEREKGILAGFAWRAQANKTVVYADLGISEGMKFGIINALKQKDKIELRFLDSEKTEIIRYYDSILRTFT